MEQQIMDAPTPEPKRPMFLTVICILTFVGAGLFTLGGFVNLASVGITRSSANMFEKMQDNMEEGNPPLPFSDSLMEELMNIPDSLSGDSLTEEQQAIKDSILSGYNNASSEELKKSAKIFKEMFGETNNILQLSMKYGYHLAAAAIIGNLLCLFGGIMMFRMRKMGFFVYITGHVVEKGIPIALLGGLASGGIFGSLMIAGQIFYWFFGVAFIIMYVFNLKHMH